MPKVADLMPTNATIHASAQSAANFIRVVSTGIAALLVVRNYWMPVNKTGMAWIVEWTSRTLLLSLGLVDRVDRFGNALPIRPMRIIS